MKQVFSGICKHCGQNAIYPGTGETHEIDGEEKACDFEWVVSGRQIEIILESKIYRNWVAKQFQTSPGTPGPTKQGIHLNKAWTIALFIKEKPSLVNIIMEENTNA